MWCNNQVTSHCTFMTLLKITWACNEITAVGACCLLFGKVLAQKSINATS